MSEDVESMLSRSRLELLEKKREIRDTVRDNYKELVGVSSHASASSDRCNSVYVTYEKMLSLSKNLRLKAATIQMNGPVSGERSDPDGMVNLSPDKIDLIHERLSLNARIMYHAQKFEFAAISNLLGQVEPPSQEALSENRFLSRFEEAPGTVFSRIETYCMRSLGSTLMNTRERCWECMSLLKRVSGGENLSSDFWSRRMQLIDSIIKTNAPTIQAIIHYDLSCSVGAEFGFSVPADIHAKYGAADGVIGIALFDEIHRSSSVRLVAQIYKSTREQFSKSRSDSSHDLSTFLIDPIFVQVTELLVRSIIANQLDLSIHDPEWNINSLNKTIETLIHDCESDLSHLFSPQNDLLRVIGQELGKQLVAVCVSLSQNVSADPKIMGINMSKILASLTGGSDSRPDMSSSIPFKRSIAPLIGIDYLPPSLGLERISDSIETVPKLESFICDQFMKYFTKLVENQQKNHRSITGYTVLNSAEVSVPMSPSPEISKKILPLSSSLIELPTFCLPYATKSAKAYIADHCAVIEKSLQGLFDLNFILTITSSMNDSVTYLRLSEQVYRETESVALADPLDRAIYKDLIRRAAYVYCVKNRIHFGPLVDSGNPRYIHGFPNCDVDEIKIRHDRIEPLDDRIDRFPTLPLAKTKVEPVKRPAADIDSRRGSASTASVSLNAATNSVTSFFNSVGSKITLGK